MAILEVQGIVSFETREPFVQVRQLDDDNNEIAGFQVPVLEAREMAHNIIEAAANATYEAALIAWAIARDPKDGETMGAMMIDAVRRFRADHWGIPSMPQDWSKKAETDE